MKTPMEKNTDILFMFDVDGTLSPSRNVAPPKIIRMLKALRERINIAFVGGSDLSKQVEQIGSDILDIFDYGFPENGVQFYRKGELVHSGSFLEKLSEEGYKKVANRILRLLSEIDCPIKRGNFIELRRSMLNVSPIGRSCSQEERCAFFEYDKKHKIREKFCKDLDDVKREYGLKCVIGGQISVDIFPEGWDKTYSLMHVKEKTIVFFGDMTIEGGNDYEIYSHERVHGVRVAGPDDTYKKVNEQLERLGIAKIEDANE